MQQLVLTKRFKQFTCSQECISVWKTCLPQFLISEPVFLLTFIIVLFVKNQLISLLLRTKQTKLFLLIPTRTASKETVVMQNVKPKWVANSELIWQEDISKDDAGHRLGTLSSLTCKGSPRKHCALLGRLAQRARYLTFHSWPYLSSAWFR